MTQLLPCPFCGEAPKFSDYLEEQDRLGCENPDCPVSPAAFEYVDRISLVNAWNTRSFKNLTDSEYALMCGFAMASIEKIKEHPEATPAVHALALEAWEKLIAFYVKVKMEN